MDRRHHNACSRCVTPVTAKAAQVTAMRTLTALLFLIATGAYAQENAALKSTLVQLETDSWKAWQARDPEFFKTFLSDDHVELGPRGSAGKAAVLATVATPKCVVANYALDRFSLHMLNDVTAVLVYHAKQDTKCNGIAVPSPVWATSIYVKRGDRWLNAVYEHTPAAD
jgi:hypothetical protein